MRMYSTPGLWFPLARSALVALPLLLAPWQPAHAEPLGRLFFSPAERALIDRPGSLRPPPAPPPRLDGIVSPSRGAPTLFLDGQARPASPRQIHLGDASAEVVGPDGRLHRLRVGAPPDAPAP